MRRYNETATNKRKELIASKSKETTGSTRFVEPRGHADLYSEMTDPGYGPDGDRFDDGVDYFRRGRPRNGGSEYDDIFERGRGRGYREEMFDGYENIDNNARLNSTHQFDTKHKVEDEKEGRTQAVPGADVKAKKPRPGDHTDHYDYYDKHESAPRREMMKAKRGTHADHYSRQRGHTTVWPTVDEMVGNDLIPADDKKKWPAFKKHKDWNKDFQHFADREDWPFRNHQKKFPWHKTDAQRFGRKDYDDFDMSNEQAARKALYDGHDPRAPERGEYTDRVLNKQQRMRHQNRDHIDMIDNIVRINSINDEIDKIGDDSEKTDRIKEIQSINDELESALNNRNKKTDKDDESEENDNDSALEKLRDQLDEDEKQLAKSSKSKKKQVEEPSNSDDEAKSLEEQIKEAKNELKVIEALVKK